MEVTGSSPVSPTRLDEIKNFRVEVYSGAVGRGRLEAEVRTDSTELGRSARPESKMWPIMPLT